MKILVPVKQTIDANVRIRVKADGSGVEKKDTKLAMNPFCEIAVEEAVRLKEAGQADEIVVVSIGTAASVDILRHALGMGADRGILVTSEDGLEPLAIARILRLIVERESPGLVILGKQSIDADNNQTGQMLAALLGWPQGTFASKIELQDGSIMVTREVDGGLERLALQRPALITTDLRLNEPRYLSLPNIMKAKKKPLERIAADELGLDLAPRLELLGVSEPAQRSGCTMTDSVEELVDRLHNEARVI